VEKPVTIFRQMEQYKISTNMGQDECAPFDSILFPTEKTANFIKEYEKANGTVIFGSFR